MKRIALLIALLIPTLLAAPVFAQATRDVQKKASSQTANVETLSANKTLTYLDAETQLLTPSGADRVVTLPSTSVWKAWGIKIANESTTLALTVNASGGSQVGTIAPAGYAEFIARTDTPSAPAGWSNLSQKVPTVPVGAIQAFGGGSCPDGWVSADGVARSSTTYVALDTYFGTTWGARSGGNFQIPNLNGQGRYLRGGAAGTLQDDATAVNGISGTVNKSAWDITASGTHTHFTTQPVAKAGGGAYSTGSLALSSIAEGNGSHAHSWTGTAPVTPSSTDTETRPITATVLYCIKY